MPRDPTRCTRTSRGRHPPPWLLAAQKPARYRPGRGSRLVFALPPGGTIDYTTAGILGALPWLDAVLHPRGEAPGTRPPRYELPNGLKLDLVPGLEVALGNGAVRGAARPGRADHHPRQGRDGRPRRGVGVRHRPARRQRPARRRLHPGTRGAASAAGSTVARLTGQVGELLDPRIPPIVVRRGTYSRKATLDETAIEAPFRLQISPTSEGHWVHAAHTVAADDAPGHVELWHTRLDTGERTEKDLLWPTEPADDETRVVRALWTRDRDDLPTADWRDPQVDQSPNAAQPRRGEVHRSRRRPVPRLARPGRPAPHRPADLPRSGPARARHASSRPRSGRSGCG